MSSNQSPVKTGDIAHIMSEDGRYATSSRGCLGATRGVGTGLALPSASAISMAKAMDWFRLGFMTGHPPGPTGMKASGLSPGSGTIHESGQESVSIGDDIRESFIWSREELSVLSLVSWSPVSGRDSRAASASSQDLWVQTKVDCSGCLGEI